MKANCPDEGMLVAEEPVSDRAKTRTQCAPGRANGIIAIQLLARTIGH